MTAVTVKEQLASLDKALQLDPMHYESRRLRAYTYYASRKYDRLREDALVMTVLRPRDPLGYSLRAPAFRELGQHREAIIEYDNAIALTPQGSPQHADLSTQRCETLLRMRDCERVVAESQECSKLWPDKPVFQYQTFCALTALGEYDTAATLFREIIALGHGARQKFRDWCAKYVFDTLESGQSWHLADHEPTGAAFLPMIEAEETHRRLSTKARRVVTDGFTARYSPDGKKIAFSAGFWGYSGLALYDVQTGQTDLLIVPGKDPAWSPDGRYLAFVRDCALLPVIELAEAERVNRHRPVADEEVWLMNSDGTQPRRLAAGGFPSWSSDAKHIYYQSPRDNALYKLAIEGNTANPQRLLSCSDRLPEISPDEKYVAYLVGGSLLVVELASQKTVAKPVLPFVVSGAIWSLDSRELCLGGMQSADIPLGLWTYNLAEGQARYVLEGPVHAISLAADGTKLLLNVPAPYYEIWAAHLDPNLSLVEALGPAQPLDEHYRGMVASYTRRIEGDPLDAYAYSDRAHYYDNLHDRTRANIDMRRWSAAVSGHLPCDCGRVINLPFDCELVFSAERPVNTIPMMSVALGQKGRREMRVFEIPMFIASLFGFCVFSSLDEPVVHADFTFGEPVNLKTVIPVLDDGYEGVNCLSSDGLEMYVESQSLRPGGYYDRDLDLWVLRRTSTTQNWDSPENLGPAINSAYAEVNACISRDGLRFYFMSNRPGGCGGYDLYQTTRTTKHEPWGQAVNMGAKINSSLNDHGPWESPDGLKLYFTSGRLGGYGNGDIYVARRAAQSDPWGDPANLGPVVNTPYGDSFLSLSPDGLLLLFQDAFGDGKQRPAGYGNADLWMVQRASLSEPWQAPLNLGAGINSPAYEAYPRISPDGCMLYFSTYSDGIWENWQAPIVPIVDFNGDGKVDAADMALLVDNWGQNEPLCDIAPFAWGDGIADEKDLMVLMERLMTPAQRAADVPCDVVLSWASPEFVDSHDVYFGTSFDDVSNATRDDPCGVLVSEGQTETTCDPEGLLEFSKTYYWRVDVIDVVVGSLEPVIYKGPVLSFTTEAYAYSIQNIIATASSSGVGTGPEKTVDGSGLDENDGHSTDGKDMWQSKNGLPQWIEFEFDQVYALHELWVWNSNTELESLLSFGAKTVTIEYSVDGAAWTTLEDVPEFAKAPGTPGYTANTIVSFGGVSAKYVKLTIEKGWATMPVVGLSEVRFFYIPDRLATQP